MQVLCGSKTEDVRLSQVLERKQEPSDLLARQKGRTLGEGWVPHPVGHDWGDYPGRGFSVLFLVIQEYIVSFFLLTRKNMVRKKRKLCHTDNFWTECYGSYLFHQFGALTFLVLDFFPFLLDFYTLQTLRSVRPLQPKWAYFSYFNFPPISLCSFLIISVATLEASPKLVHLSHNEGQ